MENNHFDWNLIWDTMAKKLGENSRYRLDLLQVTRDRITASNGAELYVVANTQQFAEGYFYPSGDLFSEKSFYPDIDEHLSKYTEYLTEEIEVDIAQYLAVLHQQPKHFPYIAVLEDFSVAPLAAKDLMHIKESELVAAFRLSIICDALRFLSLFGPTCKLYYYPKCSEIYPIPFCFASMDNTAMVWLAQMRIGLNPETGEQKPQTPQTPTEEDEAQQINDAVSPEGD